MKVVVNVEINSSVEKVWQAITDIENSVNMITGIEKIEVLEQAENALVGLKWRETRTMFGKTATEIMWITDAIENSYYKTRAESHGSIYETILSVTEQDSKTLLKMEFGAKAQNFGTLLMSVTIGLLFKGMTKKALMQDLEDIKNYVEKMD